MTSFLRRPWLNTLACLPLVLALSAHADDTDDARALYGIGYLLAEQLGELELSEQEADQLLDGFRDRLLGVTPDTDPRQDMDLIGRFITERQAQAASKVREREQAYIREFVDAGGTLTDSGLAYQVIEEGSGEPPRATDTVEVHYEGRLTNGEVFDSSHERGQPATFPLNRVIDGWTEGLQLIAPGGKIRLVIPAELAYGDQGSPPTIPGGATLIFDVELLDVK